MALGGPMQRYCAVLILLLCSCTLMVERRDLPLRPITLNAEEHTKQVRDAVLQEVLYTLVIDPDRKLDRFEVLICNGDFVDSVYVKVRLTWYSPLNEFFRQWETLEGFVARWNPCTRL